MRYPMRTILFLIALETPLARTKQMPEATARPESSRPSQPTEAPGLP